MDKVRDIFSYFVAALAMFAFLGAVSQAFQNEKGSAVTLGTLFLIGALIVFLPQVEFIKTLGVEAKLRQTVNEATAILERLKRLSAISAKSTYMSMAWGARIDAPKFHACPVDLRGVSPLQLRSRKGSQGRPALLTAIRSKFTGPAFDFGAERSQLCRGDCREKTVRRDGPAPIVHAD
jgi:hypothetical protein